MTFACVVDQLWQELPGPCQLAGSRKNSVPWALAVSNTMAPGRQSAWFRGVRGRAAIQGSASSPAFLVVPTYALSARFAKQHGVHHAAELSSHLSANALAFAQLRKVDARCPLVQPVD